jgi:hypothetical protein
LAVRAAVKPVDVIEEMFITDVGVLGMGSLALAPLKVEFDANARS